MNTSFLNGTVAHKVLAVLGLGLVFAISYFSVPALFTTEKVKSSTIDNLSGWVYAGGGGAFNNAVGIGWISFNSTDCDLDANGFVDVFCGGDNTSTPVVDYGVNVNETARQAGGVGAFSGKAWGKNVGWISFDRAETGAPPGPPNLAPNLAQINWATGNVTGWARALAPCTTATPPFNPLIPCTSSGPGPNSGGWDGWIKLSDPSWANGVRGAVGANGAFRLSGLAWGDVVIGWVNFNPIVNGVSRGPVLASAGGGVQCTAPQVISWGPWIQSTVCTAASGGTPIVESRSGSCGVGFVGFATATQTSGSCPIVAPAPPLTCGNGICEINPPTSETPQSCPTDCKPKFRQF